ncbi:MAG: hypothetical protein C5B50_25295 [Verrucomicrobia bacterium]|nr:MAG: hypothetical protein C5B50_25295 [Verrucomicrobiota bacterium]
MTKLIATLIILVVLFIGWHVFRYYQEVSNEEENKKTQQTEFDYSKDPTRLPGMPGEYAGPFEMALKEAQKNGANGLKDWLQKYGPRVRDPRKAWIELDYCQLLLRQDIPEAKRVFTEVKTRTSKASPVFKRVKEMEAATPSLVQP